MSSEHVETSLSVLPMASLDTATSTPEKSTSKFVDEGDSPRLQEAKWNAKHDLCKTTIFVTASTVVVGVILLSILLLVYIFGIHNAYRDTTAVAAVISTGNIQYIITISGLLATFVSRTVPAVVVIYGYHVAANWLRNSQLSASQDRPSPLQYVVHPGLLTLTASDI